MKFALLLAGQYTTPAEMDAKARQKLELQQVGHSSGCGGQVWRGNCKGDL